MAKLPLVGALVALVAIQACSPDSTVSPLAPDLTGPAFDAAPAPGVVLSVSKSAHGYFDGNLNYDWSLTQKADKSALRLAFGTSDLVTYTVIATRKPRGATPGGYGVSGEICVTNGGPVATEGLRIVDYLEYWDDAQNDWVVFHETQVDASTLPQLPPHMGAPHCYPYDIRIEGTPPESPIGYHRNRVRVFVDNFFEEYDPEWAQGPAPFEFPAEPVLEEFDADATLASAAICPFGFRCEPFLKVSKLSASTTVTMEVKVTRASHYCSPYSRTLLGGSLLREEDSRSLRTAWAKTDVTCL